MAGTTWPWGEDEYCKLYTGLQKTQSKKRVKSNVWLSWLGPRTPNVEGEVIIWVLYQWPQARWDSGQMVQVFLASPCWSGQISFHVRLALVGDVKGHEFIWGVVKFRIKVGFKLVSWYKCKNIKVEGAQLQGITTTYQPIIVIVKLIHT